MFNIPILQQPQRPIQYIRPYIGLYHKSRCLHKYYDKYDKRNISLNSIPIDWELQSRIIGEGITLFTFTYCTLNWLLYRRIRKQLEKNEDEKTNKTNNTNKK